MSLIIPVLLYHGQDRWKYRTLKDLFKDIVPEWAGYVPSFDYIYHNLSEVPDEQLEVLSNNFLKASLLALKHIFEKQWLETNAVRLLIWAENIPENLQKGFYVYLLDHSELKRDKIMTIIEGLPWSIRPKVGSTLYNLLEEGRREKAEKVIRNLIKASVLTDEQIASATEVPVDEVNRIREEMKNSK